jgi:predicted transcriptional regulator
LIRKRRGELGLSRQQLASRVGCSMSYLALLEGGYMPGASDVLPRIMRVLDENRPDWSGRVVLTTSSAARTGRHVEG